MVSRAYWSVSDWPEVELMPHEPVSLPPFAVGSVCGLGTAFKVQRLYKYVPHSVRDWKLTSTLSGCS